jgi:hypothetical protein
MPGHGICDISSSQQLETMEGHKGEVFRIYIVEKGSLSDVLAILKNNHAFDVKYVKSSIREYLALSRADHSCRPKALKTQLSRWGFTKYIKRGDVVEVLRAKTSRDAAGKESTFELRGRPINLEQVEKHRKKAWLPPILASTDAASPAGLASSSARGIVCRTPPPSPRASLPVIESWRVPEKLLYDVDVLVKGSFEGGRWKFNGNDSLIVSSPREVEEKLALHDFLGNLANGSAAANTRDYDLALTYWRQASENVDTLVQGQYHDIIPNLFQQINDMDRQGLGPVAATLKAHIAEASVTYSTPGQPGSTIFAGLGRLEMATMVDMEERIMSRFNLLFEQYLGYRCYNSFVMTMDTARRRLLHNPWTTFAECLPDLAGLDSIFGPSDRRSLDVIGLRVEIFKNRAMPHETEVEALALIQRAEGVLNDDWQRFYHLTRGWYFLGWAQCSIPEKRHAAVDSFQNALHTDDELRRIDDFHIFVPERTEMLKYLGELRGLGTPIDIEEMGNLTHDPWAETL